MINIYDYKFDKKIREDINEIIYKGTRLSDNTKVRLVVIKSNSQEIINRYKKTYEITKNLNVREVIKSYEFGEFDNKWIYVIEDFKGVTLREIIEKNRISINMALDIAISICKMLQKLYHKKVIHKNLNPNNVFVDIETGDIKVKWVGVSFLYGKNDTTLQKICKENVIEYISPEQTGRINRKIDHTTDYYSLGVILYEMLTGKVPFKTEDTLNVIYSHIAQEPVCPNDINSKIPTQISNIIMKLLMKNPEDRYNSAKGIEEDLQSCKVQYTNYGRISRFSLGKKDVSLELTIPNIMYGRKKELNMIMNKFNKLKKGKKQLLLVSGETGIGKTRLIEEFESRISEYNKLFITVKCDKHKQNTPYYSGIEVLKVFIKKVLTKNKNEYANIKERLNSILGKDIKKPINVFAILEKIKNKWLKEEATKNIINRESDNFIIKEFTRLFEEIKYPIIVFFDNIHWIDRDTKIFVKNLLNNKKITHFFIIGTHKYDKEIKIKGIENHISDDNLELSMLYLKQLNKQDANTLISDVLLWEEEKTKEITDAILGKTSGNTLFIIQFLKYMYKKGIIYYDLELDCYNCDIESIYNQNISSNVYGMIREKIKRLPKTTQEVLEYGACIGRTFNITLLAYMINQPEKKIISKLIPAIDSEIIYFNKNDINDLSNTMNTNENICSFSHDCIQQAVWSLIWEENKNEIHIKAARILLKNTKLCELDDKVFEIVNHYNISMNLIKTYSELIQVAELNITAANKAKTSCAYETALIYYSYASTLLDRCSNKNDKIDKLRNKIMLNKAECENIIGNYNTAKKILENILKKETNDIYRIKAYISLIKLHMNIGQYEEGVKLGLSSFKDLGIDINKELDVELKKIEEKLKSSDIDKIYHLSQIEDKCLLLIMKLLFNVTLCAKYNNDSLWIVFIIEIVKLSLKHGNCDISPMGYSSIGVILGLRGNIELGYECGKLAIKLNKKYKNKEVKSIIYLTFSFMISIWKKHISTAIKFTKEAYNSALNIGYKPIISIAAVSEILILLVKGENLDKINYIRKKYSKYKHNKNNKNTVHLFKLIDVIMDTLENKNQKSIGLDFSNHKNFKKHILEKKDNNLMRFYYVFNIRFLYMFDNYKEALKEIKNSQHLFISQTVTIKGMEYYFYYSLVIASLYNEDLSLDKKNEYIGILKKNKSLLRKMAECCSDNYMHKYLLIKAEVCRILNRHYEAQTAYVEAIEKAHKNDFLLDAAIGNETASKYYLSRNLITDAKGYIKQSRQYYRKLNIGKKIQYLHNKYPNLLFDAFINDKNSKNISCGHQYDNFNINKIVKISQMISSEIEADKLLKKVMEYALINSGAQKGFLILKENDNLIIKVAGKINCNNKSIYIKSELINNSKCLPTSVIYYAQNMREDIILNTPFTHDTFAYDEYFKKNDPKSILCSPILYNDNLIGIVYLQNDIATHVFTKKILEFLRIIFSQAAISLHNAYMYDELNKLNNNLEEKVNDRTKKLQSTVNKLEKEISERKEIAKKLLLENKFNTSIINNMSEGLCVFHETLQYPYINFTVWNRQMVQITGYTMEEINKIGWQRSIYSNSEIRQRALNLYNKVKNGKKLKREELVLKRKDNKNRIVSVSTSQLDSNSIIVLMRDVTQEKETYDNLVKSEQQLKEVTENAMDMVCKLSLDGTYKYASPSHKDIVGYSDDYLTSNNRKPFHFFHPNDRHRIKKQFDKMLDKNIQARVEGRFRHKDGNYVWIEAVGKVYYDSNGQAEGVVVCSRNVTQRKNFEQELSESKKRYKLLVELLPDAVFVVCDSKILYANKMAAKNCGVERPEYLIGKNVNDIVKSNGDYKSLFGNEIKELTKDGPMKLREQSFIRKSDGKIINVETTAVRFPYKGRSTILVVSRDIEERKKAEEYKRQMEKKKRLLRETLEYNKLRTEFFANISHELRTPLNVTLGAVQMISYVVENSNNSNSNDKIIKYVRIMRQNCYRLIRLVNNLIDITKMDSGYFKLNMINTDIIKVIEDITLSIANYIEDKGIDLIFDTEIEEKNMAFDPDKLERIILNLISNAVKFTHKCGTITVYVKEKDDNILVSVQDTGEGIPKDKQKKIFERFIQVDKSLTRNHEGSGIGLSLVKSLVQMHKGDIWVKSKLGEGSIFTFSLPINTVVNNDSDNNKFEQGIQSKVQKIEIEFSDIYYNSK